MSPPILLNGDVPRRSNEPAAINSFFGWVLVGKLDSYLNAYAIATTLFSQVERTTVR